MDEMEKEKQLPSEELTQEEGYVQRPAWQVWGARVALVIFIFVVIMQILGIARGGL